MTISINEHLFLVGIARLFEYGCTSSRGEQISREPDQALVPPHDLLAFSGVAVCISGAMVCIGLTSLPGLPVTTTQG
ncbi:hypothetical protein [Brucella cytisi]|uniref:hypothetical protein n=1 Tax=Brucella cytisi TaxID=407152 RepID=UPI00313B7F1E